ncbi:hypothetical protein HDU97_003556 [Phlyctochytrium planicorne]|nr:hypothetical protein HDU97_003556 [Phlyctochytrium planicorne]
MNHQHTSRADDINIDLELQPVPLHDGPHHYDPSQLDIDVDVKNLPPPPTFEEAMKPGLRETSTATATDPMQKDEGEFVDLSIIPTENILFRRDVQPMAASTAKFERTWDGVESSDEMLQQNPDELFKFFLTHLIERPGLSCNIQGTHQVTSHHNGKRRTRTVTDFAFKIPLDACVHPEWHAAFALPNGQRTEQRKFVQNIGAHVPEHGVESGQFKTVLEEFTASKNLLKEIQMEKEIPWNYQLVRQSMFAAIRSTGYRGNISVSFPRTNHKMAVFASSKTSKIYRNKWTWLFLKAVKERLAAHYAIGLDPRLFYQRNVVNVVMSVRMRVKGGILPLIV